MQEVKRPMFRDSNGMCRLAIRVKPNCQTNRVLGYNTERMALEIALNARPQDGEANQALIELLSDVLRIPKDRIKIVAGKKSRDKILQIECSTSELEDKLSHY